MDRLTAAVFSRDGDAAAALYGPDAVAVTPDAGELRGREAIVGYLFQFAGAFPDFSYELAQAHESGNTAIDEGYVVGTHTRPLPTPTGETIPPTNKRIRVRSCDVATVENGLVVSHRFYFDQMEFMAQVGLTPGG